MMNQQKQLKFFLSAGIALTCLAGMIVGATEIQPVACTMEYAPVCGSVQVQCITAPCPPVQQTFGNKCALENNSLPTVSLYAGECRDRMIQPTAQQHEKVAQVFDSFFAKYQTSEDVLTEKGVMIARSLLKVAVNMIEQQEQLIIVSTMTPEQSAKVTTRLAILYAVQDYAAQLIMNN